MRFKVCFVHNVKAEPIAKRQKSRVVGVVAGTDGVDVVLFHDHQIADHVVDRSGRAQHGVAVVAIDALGLDLLSVEVQHAVLDGDVLKANGNIDKFAARMQVQGIEVGRFIVPQCGGVHGNGKFACTVNDLIARCNGRAVGRGKRIGHLRLARERQLAAQRRACKIVRHRGMIVNIHDMHGIAQKQVYVAENARPAELVLVFQIACLAPLEHQHLDAVFTCVQVRGDINFAGHMADLAVGNEGIVDIEVEAGVYALKIDAHRLLQHLGVHVKAARVHAAGIDFGDVGGIEREGVDHVCIVGRVVAAAKHGLPGAGHLDLVGRCAHTNRVGQLFG